VTGLVIAVLVAAAWGGALALLGWRALEKAKRQRPQVGPGDHKGNGKETT
jgi:hypothetical protein